MKMKKIGCLAAMLALASSVAACGDDGDDAAAGSGGEEGTQSVQVGISTSWSEGGATYMLLAAEELGYFAEEDLDVEIVPGSGSGALVEQIVAGNIAIGTPSLGAVVEGLGAGLDLVNPYSLSYAFNFGVYVPEDSPLQEVGELEGGTVGITEAGGGEVAVLSAALGNAGLDAATDVEQLPIGTGDATTLSAISDGTVDAYASSTVELYSIQVNGGLELRSILPDNFAELPSRGLITTSGWLEDNPDVMTKVARAMAKATLYCEYDTDTCQDFLREAGPELWEENDEGVSVGELVYEEAWEGSLVAEDGQYGEHRVEGYEEFKAIGAVDGDDDWSVEDFLPTDLLEDVNDFDRQAVIDQATEAAAG